MPAVAAVPLFWGSVAAGGAAAASSIYGANRQSASANQAARTQTDAANRAAELESRSAQEALAFAREQEQARQREFQSTQDRNYGIYQDETGYAREQQAQQLARRAPFVGAGQGALGQLAQPIPGSLGDLTRRR